MTLRKTSGSLVMTSFGLTRISEPDESINEITEGHTSYCTILVVGFHECVRLSAPE